MNHTRRFYCRCGFLLFCAIPTVLVLIWVLFPATTSTWENRLSTELGLHVSIQQASQPRPNATLLRGVEVADPELGTLATARIAEIVETQRGHVTLVSQPEIQCDRLHRAFELIEDQLRQNRSDTSRLRLVAGELTMRSAEGTRQRAETLADVTCELTFGDVPSVTIRFRRYGQSTPEPVVLKLERHAGQAGLPTTRWSLNTGGAFLPTWLLASQMRGLCRLGDDCEFQGLAWGEITDAGFQGEVNGRFRNVDLYRLVQEQFPHTLNGTGEMQLVRAEFRDGRLIAAAGSLQCSGGSIGQSLLANAAAQWNLDLRTKTRGDVVRFAGMDIGFEVDGSSVKLSGHCGERASDWLVDDLGNPILAGPSETAAPVLSLVRVLVTQSEVQVPLTEETASLLSIFPVPAVKRSAEQAMRPPATTLRLDGAR